MKTAFICYEPQDVKFAERLVADLDKWNVKSWFEAREVSSSEVREVEVQKAIRNHESFLIILSNNSTSSKRVLYELAYARVDNKTIIPVVIDNCEIPKQLQHVESIDFRNTYQGGLRQIIERLSAHQAAHIDAGENKSNLTETQKRNKKIVTNNVLDQSKHIVLNESKVAGDVFIGEKQTTSDSSGSASQSKPFIQILTIIIGLIGIGLPIWWFLNNSSKDVLGYLLPLLIVVLSILITLIGVFAPDQLVKIILSVLGSKKE